MSAIPHLYQRLRRWFAMQNLQARASQLAGLIRQIEADMKADADEHATLLMELRRTNARLLAAERHQQQPRRGTAW